MHRSLQREWGIFGDPEAKGLQCIRAGSKVGTVLFSIFSGLLGHVNGRSDPARSSHACLGRDAPWFSAVFKINRFQ